ncbi:MAG: peptidylprolyl isomerase [bacterium]|nr:peptidylprolyl isomerase [bacterium]
MDLRKAFLVFSFILWSISNLQARIVERIVAKVNAEVITLSELEDAKLVGNNREDVLNHLIEEKLILQEAKRQEIQVTDTEIDRALMDVKNRFGTNARFEEAISKQGISVDELRHEYEKRLLAAKLVEKEVRSKIGISEKEWMELYKPYLYQIRVQHILVKTKEEAEEILNKLKKGEDFTLLAKRFSICSSGETGGDLGFLNKGEMVKDFEDAAFLLGEGKISEPVHTHFGFHIIKCIEKRKTPEEVLIKILKRLKSQLLQKRFEERYTTWINQLKDKAYIEIFIE